MNTTGQRLLPGFLLSGFLLALPGALLPALGFHLAAENRDVALCFLSVWAGVLVSSQMTFPMLARTTLRMLLSGSCFLAGLALCLLASISASGLDRWEPLVWSLIGLAAGGLNGSLFRATEPLYQQNAASTVTLSGIYFGLGCVLSALVMAGTFTLFSVQQALLLVAGTSAGFGIWLFRAPLSAAFQQETAEQKSILRFPSYREFLRPSSLIFLVLLVVQSANEWTIAGWLALFLIHRLGLSPQTAVWLLAVYWAGLLTGRVITVFLLSFFRHGRLLMASAIAALGGCFLLVLTNNTFGAVCGILLTGFGFAAIYPLLAEKAGGRFPSRHPAALHTMFSLAVAGGMVAPGAVGLLADEMGLWVVMSLPALGVFIVVVLLLLIWLQSKVTGQ